jgi:hypothetical protein
LTLFLAGVYLANRREIGQYDTEPTTLAALTLARGSGPWLDRFRLVLREGDGRLPAFVTRSRGHIASRYPIAPALVAVPLVWPQTRWFDSTRPGWDRHPGSAWAHAKFMGKNAAAVLAALVGLTLHRVLRAMRFGRVAIPAVLAACLGSDLWTVASQALWQHGPAALALSLAILLLLPSALSPARCCAAGCAAAILVACRSIDIVFAATIAAYLFVNRPRSIVWFLPAPLAIGAALLAYNLAYFGAISGGQAQLEAMHPELHGVEGPWAGHLVEGAAGTLLSPARGLLVYSPWIALALATLPFTWRRLWPWPVVRWLVVALVPYVVVLSKYAVWWGGHCFGPRYWTDAMPLFAILLAAGLEWSLDRKRIVTLLFALTIAIAVAIQLIGACCFPSSWNLAPANVDRHHERLWDWRDTELRRCLTETFK